MNFKNMLIASSLVVFLGGCAMAAEEKHELIVSRCPTLKKYTTEQMAKAADELKKIPTDSQIATLLADYSKLRDACRIAEKQLRTQK